VNDLDASAEEAGEVSLGPPRREASPAPRCGFCTVLPYGRLAARSWSEGRAGDEPASSAIVVRKGAHHIDLSKARPACLRREPRCTARSQHFQDRWRSHIPDANGTVIPVKFYARDGLTSVDYTKYGIQNGPDRR